MTNLSEKSKGRPSEVRSDVEDAVYDRLEQLGIKFERVDHDQANTMEDCKEIESRLGAVIPKNLVLANRQNTEFYLLMMPPDKPFKTKEITSQLGCARLSFAQGEALEKLLHTIPGSASVLGLMFDTEGKVQLLIDRDLLGLDEIGVHPGRSTSTVKLSLDDALRFARDTRHEPVLVSLSGEG